MIPILCLPSFTGSDLDASGMNWTCLVWGGPMFLILVWWVVDAHKWFAGPKVNIQHQMLGREGNVLEGKEGGSDSDQGTTIGAKDVDKVAEV